MGFGNYLETDSVAETFVLNVIQNSFREMTQNLVFEQLGLPKLPSNFSFVAFDESLIPKDHDELQILDSNIKKIQRRSGTSFQLNFE